MTVETGYLCWCWFEELYQVLNEDDFNKVDLSVRGELPEPYFKQITCTFNPWSEKHWSKKRFFDVKEPDNILALTTNYMLNEFFDAADKKLYEDMKIKFPRRYRVEGLGEWGISEGLVYDNWEEKNFDYKEIIQQRPGIESGNGLDFGYTTDPTGFIRFLIDLKEKEIFIFDEHYQAGMLNNQIADMLKYKGCEKEIITADSAEPKSIAEIKGYGIRRIKAAVKGKDSVQNGIQFLKQFRIYVHPKCTNTALEFSNYAYDKNKEGKLMNSPIGDYNHIMDAMRYGAERFITTNTFRW